MILIFIAILIAFAAGCVLVFVSENGYETRHIWAFMLGLASLVFSATSAIAFSFTAYAWFAADYKAKIINREFGTNYTKEEVFWAGDVIDTIREVARKRIEVNGNVMRPDAVE